MHEQLTFVTIPHGILLENSWIQQVGLRELNGQDENLVAKTHYYPIPFRTTALLERFVRFADLGSANAELVRQLTVGDRIALMLGIRRMAFGDKLNCTLSCPMCKELMSMDLSVSKFLSPSMQEPRSEYSVNVGDFLLKMRPLTGADLESLFVNDIRSSSREKERLARSCIISSDPPLPDSLNDDFIAMLSSKLEEVDPQSDIVLNLACPSCRESFQTQFNAEDFVFREIDSRLNLLETEVHWIAFAYHWSEESILSLSLKSRKRYVDLIHRTLAGEGLSGVIS
jgi:hypothetical protein